MSLIKLQQITDELEELKYQGEQGIPILIEGRKDEEAAGAGRQRPLHKGLRLQTEPFGNCPQGI